MFPGVAQPADLEADIYAFGEMSVPVTDDFQIQLAARYENYGDDVGSTVNPKISMRWQANDWIAVRASAGSTFRGPLLTQLTTSNVVVLSLHRRLSAPSTSMAIRTSEPETAVTYSAVPAMWNGSGPMMRSTSFEKDLFDSQTIVVKFWLAISKDEQAVPKAREETPA